jgi:hypothetical protein
MMKSWSARIEDAGNHMDLLAVARDFLDSWEHEDLALIPEEARPQRVKGVDDLAYWHQKLVDSFCNASLGMEQLVKVREMLHFFAFAVQRSVEIEGVPAIAEHEAAAQLFSERSVPALFTSAMTGSTEH